MINKKIQRDYTIEDLEELLDNIPYEIYMKNIDGVYKYANKATIDRIGLTIEEVIGKNDYDLRAPEMARICVNGDRVVLKNGDKAFIEDKIINENIETRYEIFKTLLYSNDKETVRIGGVAKFVTEDKSLCKGIIENSNNIMNKSKEISNDIVYNEILNDLQNNIKSDDVAIYLFNIEKGTMKLYNHLGKHNSIFPSTYIINDDLKDIYLDNYECEIKENLNDGSIKYIYLLKNNNQLLGCVHIYFRNKPVELQEEFIRYICIVLAFTEANKMLTDNLNRELNEKCQTEKKLQMMIDSIIDVYALIKKVESNLIWIEISERCNEVIGWTVDELNAQSYIDFIHPKDKDKFKDILNMKHKDIHRGPFTIRNKEGKWITIDAEINNVRDDIYMVIAKDVTTLTELKKDKENLTQAVEVEGLKTQFFGNMSHEFKTPLNIILSTIQLVMNYMEINGDMPDKASCSRYLRSIRQNSYRLLKLANNMIDITKIDGDYYQMNIGNYNIVEIVENIVQSLVEYIKDNKRSIIFDTMEEEIITACDPDQIERIILNLLSNAMKFTNYDGNIYVSMEVNDECNKVIIKIGNDGQPISIEDSEKIFERFTQSENLLTRSIEGSGIGLSLVKSLVELHEGVIYVNTEVSKGTEFCIELPIRKLINGNEYNVREKTIYSKVEKFDIEFSDIYNY